MESILKSIDCWVALRSDSYRNEVIHVKIIPSERFVSINFYSNSFSSNYKIPSEKFNRVIDSNSIVSLWKIVVEDIFFNHPERKRILVKITKWWGMSESETKEIFGK